MIGFAVVSRVLSRGAFGPSMESEPELLPSPFSGRPLWGDALPPRYLPAASRGGSAGFPRDHILRVRDVPVPALDFRPATAPAGRPPPAVVVCPGGGYHCLAWNLEGTDPAAWLNSIGVSAFILKYRCPCQRDAALCDAARAVRIVRSAAAALRVRADAVGILGFSAGAHLAARLCTLPAGEEPYPPTDAIDRESPRPDFQLLVYPAYIEREDGSTDPGVRVTPETPPAFLAQAGDDELVGSALAYYRALHAAGVPAELHVFPRGGHGFGLLRNGSPAEVWPELAGRWLAAEVRGDHRGRPAR